MQPAPPGVPDHEDYINRELGIYLDPSTGRWELLRHDVPGPEHPPVRYLAKLEGEQLRVNEQQLGSIHDQLMEKVGEVGTGVSGCMGPVASDEKDWSTGIWMHGGCCM